MQPEAKSTTIVNNKKNETVEIFGKRKRIDSTDKNSTPVITSVSSSTSRHSMIQRTHVSSDAKTVRRQTISQGSSKISSLLAAYKSSNASANAPSTAKITTRRMTTCATSTKSNSNNKSTDVAKENVKNGVNGQLIVKMVRSKQNAIEKPVPSKQTGKESLRNSKPNEQWPNATLPRIIRIVSKANPNNVSKASPNNVSKASPSNVPKAPDQNMPTKNNPFPMKSLLKCDECDYATEVRTNLNRHKLVHTGEKPFVCRHCKRGFTQKVNLVSHLSNNHRGQK